MHSPIATTYLTETLSRSLLIPSGELANYIPELAAVDPDKLAASIAMVDGEQYAAGDLMWSSRSSRFHEAGTKTT